MCWLVLHKRVRSERYNELMAKATPSTKDFKLASVGKFVLAS